MKQTKNSLLVLGLAILLCHPVIPVSAVDQETIKYTVESIQAYEYGRSVKSQHHKPGGCNWVLNSRRPTRRSVL